MIAFEEIGLSPRKHWGRLPCAEPYSQRELLCNIYLALQWLSCAAEANMRLTVISLAAASSVLISVTAQQLAWGQCGGLGISLPNR